MFKNIFLTIVFFILDHFFLLLASGFLSLIAMKYCYKIWQDQLRAPDTRYLSLAILILLTILLIIFLAALLYIITIIIIFLPDLRKLMGK